MKKKILFVDDDIHLLEGFRVNLRSKRSVWDTRFVTSGKDALEQLKEQTFDVVVTDMRMPGMDGATLLEQVQQIQPGAIRIVLSGYSDTEAVLRTAKPAHQYLAKPCSMDVLINTLERALRLQGILTEKKLRKVINRIDALPALPSTYTELLRELQNNEPSLTYIASLVERDPGVCATLLKLVNSAFFGLYEHIDTPSRAVMLLGTETLKGLLLGVHLLAEFRGVSFKNVSFERLWAHSFRTATFARAIAAMESKDKDFIDSCHVAGLLHDVGKLVLVREFKSRYLEVLRAVQEEGRLIFEAENELFGVSHAEVGAYLLGVWNLSEQVIFSVYNHHHVATCDSYDFDCPLCVHVADYLEHELVILNQNYKQPLVNVEQLEERGLVDKLPSWRERCEELLEREHES